MTIDAYLLRLERLLPWTARFRVLPEIREHLRDAARRGETSGLSPFEAEAGATREFGAVDEVASQLGSELAVRETRLASVVAFVATVLFIFPLYVVPQMTLPPAPWETMPDEIASLQSLALGLWALACVASGAGVIAAWTRWSFLSARLLFCAGATSMASIGVSIGLAVRWFSLTPSTPNWALGAPLAVVALLVCVGAWLWARSSARRLVVQIL